VLAVWLVGAGVCERVRGELRQLRVQHGMSLTHIYINTNTRARGANPLALACDVARLGLAGWLGKCAPL
jgi:hypothetical protein